MSDSDQEKIPRTIHYCWFGKGEKPRKLKKCMASWKKNLPDFEFVEWNESRFDVEALPYTAEAYKAGKYAFVSDVARLYGLVEMGGIYLDTDVEVIRPLDRFLHHSAFSGFEDGVHLQSGTMGAQKGHPWFKELLAEYEERKFILEDGSFDMTTNTSMMTRNAKGHGLSLDGSFQILDNGVVFYPRTYFSPYDYINGGNYLSENSYTIHHYAGSWMPAHVRWRSEVKRVVGRALGPGFIAKMRTMIKR